ncbi:MAG TPA: Ku protein [Candidatus Obscuribacterales bacterium]
MAPRAIWTGIITFGMVSIPVKLYTATENKDISFNQLHKDCKSRIKEIKTCPVCDRKIESEEIEKGYEYAKGQYVIVSKDDLEKLPLPNKDCIEITSFIQQSEIDPVFYEKSYFIEPDEAARKPFALFMRALQDKGMTAIAKVAIRSKERLCALRPLDGTLMMSTLFYPDEIRVEKRKALPDVNITDKELAMAGSLIDLMTQEFQPSDYTDNYREAVLKIIEAKLEGREIAEAPPIQTGKVIDLMEALQASMENVKAKKSREKTRESAATAPASKGKKKAAVG